MTPPTPAYYGPQTLGEAISRIEALAAERIDLRAAVDRSTNRMDTAGNTIEAKKVRKYFRSAQERHANRIAR